ALLYLLAHPAPEGWGAWLWPAACAVLLPLTGLGAGACQERLRRRAERQPAPLWRCWLAALRRGHEHVAARAAVLAGSLVGVVFLAVLPALMLWASTTTVHAAIAAGRGGISAGLGSASRAATVDPGRSSVVTLLRLPALAMGFFNLHLLVLA